MLFSIIIPVHNVESYLQECLDSVLHQSYPQFEIILVDDGSTDNSGKMCDTYALNHPDKVRCLHLEGVGPLCARSHGVQHALGDVLVFLDSDDCLRLDALERLSQCFQQHRCDMVFYNISTHPDHKTKDIGCGLTPNTVYETASKETVCRMLVNGQICNAVVIKAVRRCCTAGFPDFTSLSWLRNGEDLLMSVYMVTSAQRFVYLDENLYYYRQRKDSITHSYNPSRPAAVRAVHQVLHHHIDLWNMPRLHPLHDARIVSGWLDCLQLLLRHRKHMDSDDFNRSLLEFAEDPFFRRAYVSMDPQMLSGTQKQLAKLLYEKKFRQMSALFQLLHLVQRLKRTLKKIA